MNRVVWSMRMSRCHSGGELHLNSFIALCSVTQMKYQSAELITARILQVIDTTQVSAVSEANPCFMKHAFDERCLFSAAEPNQPDTGNTKQYTWGKRYDDNLVLDAVIHQREKTRHVGVQSNRTKDCCNIRCHIGIKWTAVR